LASCVRLRLAEAEGTTAPRGRPPRGAILTRLRSLARENAELRAAVAELERFREMAFRDELSGLWNRRYFEQRLRAELSRIRRQPAGQLSLLVIDLDGLKQLNDRHGHAAGDDAIRRAARFLQSRLREHDVCCRTGGDEFVVILPELGASNCAPLISRLRREQVRAAARGELPLSFSMGSASHPGVSAGMLFTQADEAMYADKRRHKLRGTGVADPAKPCISPR
jgi:diguanylate cyclase (GGDEF)-like protein